MDVEIPTITKKNKNTMGNSGSTVKLDDGIYEGELDKKTNKPNGKGMMTYNNGNIFRGHFRAGYRHGQGELKFSWGGDAYHGEFAKDQMCGRGKFIYSNGDVYDGLFKDDNMHGAGTLKKKTDGTIWSQEWKEGKMVKNEEGTPWQIVSAVPAAPSAAAAAATTTSSTKTSVAPASKQSKAQQQHQQQQQQNQQTHEQEIANLKAQLATAEAAKQKAERDAAAAAARQNKHIVSSAAAPVSLPKQSIYFTIPPTSTVESSFLRDWHSFIDKEWNHCNDGRTTTTRSSLKRAVRVLRVTPLSVPPVVIARFDERCKTMGQSSNVKFLWHGTASAACATGACGNPHCSLDSIAQQGFRPDMADPNSVSFQTWGQSAYFGEVATVAHGYNGKSEHALGSGRRVAIYCAVALGPQLIIGTGDTNNYDSDDDSSSARPTPNFTSTSVENFRKVLGREPAAQEMKSATSAIPMSGAPRFRSIAFDFSKDWMKNCVHHMCAEPGSALPLFAVEYCGYPCECKETMPPSHQFHTEQAGAASYCPKHGMKHLGVRGGCDASPFMNDFFRPGNSWCTKNVK